MTKAKGEIGDEGARDFGVILAHIDDGAVHAECSMELRELLATLHGVVDLHGGVAKGKLILTIDLAAHENGTVDVTADVKTKEPRSKRARSVFWLTKGNNLSPDNPRQQKLPLREVPIAHEKHRDIGVDDRSAHRTL